MLFSRFFRDMSGFFRGTSYHCSRCGHSFTVYWLPEFIGLVGEDDIRRQCALNLKYGTDLTKDHGGISRREEPYLENIIPMDSLMPISVAERPYLFHVEDLICQACFQACAPDLETTAKQEVMLQLEAIQRGLDESASRYREILREHFVQEADKWLENYSFRQQQPELVAAIAQDKHVTDLGRLKKLVRKHFADAKGRYEAELQPLLIVSPGVAEILERYKKEFETIMTEVPRLLTELGKERFSIWVSLDVQADTGSDKEEFYCEHEVVPCCYKPKIRNRIEKNEAMQAAFSTANGSKRLKQRLMDEVMEVVRG